MRNRRHLTAATLCVAAATVYAAQPEHTPGNASGSQPAVDADAPVIEPLEKNWTIRLEPAVGYIGPAGEVRLPSSTTRGGVIDLEFLNLDSPRLSPVGRIRARRGKWTFALSGLGFSASGQSAVQTRPRQVGPVFFGVGDTVTSDLSYQSFDLLASYRVWQNTPETNGEGQIRLDAGVDLIGGVRFHHAEFDVRNAPAITPAPGTPLTAGADEVFAEPVIGARLELDMLEQFGMEVESTAGAFGFDDRSSVSFTIDAGFVYRPVRPVGIKVGYRMQIYTLTDGDGAQEFEWSGSMAGLYFGAQISF